MPGKFASALAALASLSVSGIGTNYAFGSAPVRLDGVTLPVLVVRPYIPATRQNKFGEVAIAVVNGATAEGRYRVTHLLVDSLFNDNTLGDAGWARVVTLVDAYADAVRANPKLTDTLYLPTVYNVYIEPVPYGGQVFYGAAFWHDWTVEI
jgi:hypothetical protein